MQKHLTFLCASLHKIKVFYGWQNSPILADPLAGNVTGHVEREDLLFDALEAARDLGSYWIL